MQPITMEEQSSLQFQLGQLTAQISSMSETIKQMAETIAGLDTRLRSNEKDTTILMAKMSGISLVAGVATSFIMHYLLK